MRGTIIFFICMLNLFIFTGLVLPGLTADEQQPLATTHTFEDLVAEWVNLRQETASEKQAWQEQKDWLGHEYGLLLKEKALLEQELDQARKMRSSHEAECVELIQSKRVSQEALDRVLPVLSRAEADLKTWQKSAPASLSVSLDKLFNELKTSKEKSVSARLRLILSLWGEIERLQSNIHVVTEVLKTGSGQEQEFEVIYLGLTQGYCVSTDNKLAGISRPAKRGWTWEWRPEIAKEVRKGIDFYKREEIAEFVELPLKIEKAGLQENSSPPKGGSS